MKSSVKKFYRFGLFSKGIVYFLIGIFAILTASFQQNRDVGSKGVIQFLHEQAFGNVLLVLIGIGLLGYFSWRWYRSIEDPEGNSEVDAKNIGKRIGYAASGTLYGGLAIYAFSLVINSSSSSGSSKQDLLNTLLNQPFGKWLIAVVAIGLLIAAIYQVYKGFTSKFMEEVNLRELSGKKKEIYEKAGQIGLPSRGVVFGIIGYFLLQVAINSNAGNMKNTDSALQVLQEQSVALAIIIAIGLTAYGVFMMIKARYRVM
ncbi:MAG: DUF1206 domain-containing protein [Bacteroidota bacterium]